MNHYDESVVAMTQSLREIRRTLGNGPSFNLFQSLANTVGLEFQTQVYDNLLSGVSLGMTKVRFEAYAEGQKIYSIKHVRAATGMRLKESKDFVELVEDSGPQILEIDGYEKALQFIANIRHGGGFACIV